MCMGKVGWGKKIEFQTREKWLKKLLVEGDIIKMNLSEYVISVWIALILGTVQCKMYVNVRINPQVNRYPAGVSI